MSLSSIKLPNSCGKLIQVPGQNSHNIYERSWQTIGPYTYQTQVYPDQVLAAHVTKNTSLETWICSRYTIQQLHTLWRIANLLRWFTSQIWWFFMAMSSYPRVHISHQPHDSFDLGPFGLLAPKPRTTTNHNGPQQTTADHSGPRPGSIHSRIRCLRCSALQQRPMSFHQQVIRGVESRPVFLNAVAQVHHDRLTQIVIQHERCTPNTSFKKVIIDI